jgi:hypothetical protein
MTHFPMAATAILALSFLAVTAHPGLAATPKCNAELRKCNSHCNLVYESSRANRTRQSLRRQFLRLQGAAQLIRHV